jgi:hypothetical protein
LKKFKPEFSNGRSAQAVVLTANGSVPTGIVPMAFLAVPAPCLLPTVIYSEEFVRAKATIYLVYFFFRCYKSAIGPVGD